MSDSSPHPSNRRRWPWVAGGVVALVAVGIVACEAAGWPFLGPPLQHWLTAVLHRDVSFAANGGSASTMRIGLFGAIRVRTGQLSIGSPTWSTAPHMLQASDARLVLGYGDLWRAYRGGALHIRALEAKTLDMNLERLTDGRSNWQFGKSDVDASPEAARLPTFGVLRVEQGTARYDDAMLAAQVDSRFSLVEGSRVPNAASGGASVVVGAPAPAQRAASAPAAGLQLSATGSYKRLPLRVEAHTSGVLPLLADDHSLSLPVTIDARVGRAGLRFDGSATDALHLGGLHGRFEVYGPSLAAAGDPLGVTLPTTAAFRLNGRLVKDGSLWKTVIDAATVGESHLSGAFTYDSARPRPLLAGRLLGSKLLLADLGPTVGAPVRTGAVASSAAASTPARAGKVLPDRPFDLPSLRAMDANVLIDIADLDLGSDLLQPLRPLKTLLVLDRGVLTLRDIDARTADGRLGGTLTLDGRQEVALWNARLRWADVKLERWIRQARSGNAPPYISGRLDGTASLDGKGRSTAAILGSLDGNVRTYLVDGRISHLAVEAAGLDIAQSLGVLIKGDDAMPIDCSIADLSAKDGVLKPRAMVVDTHDSTLWIDGSMSLASEALDLRVIVEPKDFSPVALRSPIHVQGTLGAPKVKVEKGPIAARLGGAALLALVNPLAAVLPLIDTGSSKEIESGMSKCRALGQRGNAAKQP